MCRTLIRACITIFNYKSHVLDDFLLKTSTYLDFNQNELLIFYRQDKV